MEFVFYQVGILIGAFLFLAFLARVSYLCAIMFHNYLKGKKIISVLAYALKRLGNNRVNAL